MNIESLIFAVFFLVCDRLLGENRFLLLYNSDQQLCICEETLKEIEETDPILNSISISGM